MDTALIATDNTNVHDNAGREKLFLCTLITHAFAGCQAGSINDKRWFTCSTSSFWEIAALLGLPADAIAKRAIDSFASVDRSRGGKVKGVCDRVQRRSYTRKQPTSIVSIQTATDASAST